RRRQREDDEDGEEHGVHHPGLAELIHPQPPAEPQERPEVLAVHDAAASSQASFGVAAASDPASWMKRSSSESPCRIASREACSASRPLTMMPTWGQSSPPISSTGEVRDTVAPRATNPASRSRMSREVIASTPSNGSSRNSRSGLGSSAAARASFFFIPCEYSSVSFFSS